MPCLMQGSKSTGMSSRARLLQLAAWELHQAPQLQLELHQQQQQQQQSQQQPQQAQHPGVGQVAGSVVGGAGTPAGSATATATVVSVQGPPPTVSAPATQPKDSK
mmetsp:Transcript_72856/g.159156  ORF Transcript_72856/g.159156 Transcript_72856/m.159156 type:complete len:105 (-) Transcript_72856:437-751(-)